MILIPQLSLKYFILNQKRTVRGSQIVALGLIAVVSTTLLLNGFSTEIVQLTGTLGREDRALIILPSTNDYFSDLQMERMELYLENSPSVQYFNFERAEFGSISVADNTINVPIHITNITRILNNNPYLLRNDAPSLINGIYITEDIRDNLEIGKNLFYTVNVFNDTLTLPAIEFLDQASFNINSGLYIDYSLIMNQTLANNLGFVELKRVDSSSKVINDISNIAEVEIKNARSEKDFLRKSAQQISNTLLILQIAISILVLLSIFNLMNTLILESKYDIRVLLSIGFSRFQVWSFFVLIGGLIGFLGGLLTIMISLVFVSSVLAILSATISVPFITISLNADSFVFILINSVVVTTIASLYPSYKGVTK